MRPLSDLPDYGTPFYLYGNAPPRAARSLPQLIAAGFLRPEDANILVTLAHRGISMAIVATSAARGKSSLLAALLPYLPAERDRYFLRGSFETFQFAQDVVWRPDRAAMIANEISDFLPVYIPRHLTKRLFRLVAQGACLWTTAHASGLDDLLCEWTDWPPDAPLAVVTIGDQRPGIVIELHDPARPGAAPHEPTPMIDSVCHAEDEMGSGDNALPVCVPALGLRPR
jgi:hypothetical protein